LANVSLKSGLGTGHYKSLNNQWIVYCHFISLKKEWIG